MEARSVNGVYNGGLCYVYTNGWDMPFEIESGSWEIHPFGVLWHKEEKEITILPGGAISRIDILYE